MPNPTLTLTCPLVQQAYNTFPDPVTASGGNTSRSGCYCVGGALYLKMKGATSPKHYGTDRRFPAPGRLSATLMKINPKLDYGQAHWFANNIIESNDALMFENAWSFANDACNYDPKK